MIMQTVKNSRQFLLCDVSGNVGPSFPEDRWTSSPLACLEKTIDESRKIIIVRFGDISIKDRETLLELAKILKRNTFTRTCVILALLETKQRQTINLLYEAGVDYVKFIGKKNLNYRSVCKLISDLGRDDELRTQLDSICPFLHYSSLDMDKEMTECGAYLDRMVLGGSRLHKLCETEDHLQCEYYQKPRLKS